MSDDAQAVLLGSLSALEHERARGALVEPLAPADVGVGRDRGPSELGAGPVAWT